jgi:hypothetical protein
MILVLKHMKLNCSANYLKFKLRLNTNKKRCKNKSNFSKKRFLRETKPFRK